jgi:hypothetical protein
MAFLGFLLVVVVGSLYAKAFFCCIFGFCFWILVCLVAVVEVNSFFLCW